MERGTPRFVRPRSHMSRLKEATNDKCSKILLAFGVLLLWQFGFFWGVFRSNLMPEDVDALRRQRVMSEGFRALSVPNTHHHEERDPSSQQHSQHMQWVMESSNQPRLVPDTRPSHMCHAQSYPLEWNGPKPQFTDRKAYHRYRLHKSIKATIVIPFRNETDFNMRMTLHSILWRTPPKLLREIVLVDDANDIGITAQMIADMELPKVTVLRNNKRQGLVRSRITGVQNSLSARNVKFEDMYVFLDSHVEVNQGWLEPLLHHLSKHPKSIVVPRMDTIRADTLTYTKGSNQLRGGVDWGLRYKWNAIPEDLKQLPADLPIKSPIIPGGMFAIMAARWKSFGEFDAGMRIWGGENVEVSFRQWMCGGSVAIIPCSRVGHRFTYTDEFGFAFPGNPDKTIASNLARIAEVWMDDYKELFYAAHVEDEISVTDALAGDVEVRRRIKEKLECKNFEWYLENVNKELRDTVWPAAAKETLNKSGKQQGPPLSNPSSKSPFGDVLSSKTSSSSSWWSDFGPSLSLFNSADKDESFSDEVDVDAFLNVLASDEEKHMQGSASTVYGNAAETASLTEDVDIDDRDDEVVSQSSLPADFGMFNGHQGAMGAVGPGGKKMGAYNFAVADASDNAKMKQLQKMIRSGGDEQAFDEGWKADVETVFGPKAVDYEAKNKDKMEGHLLSQLNKKNAITVAALPLSLTTDASGGDEYDDEVDAAPAGPAVGKVRPNIPVTLSHQLPKGRTPHTKPPSKHKHNSVQNLLPNQQSLHEQQKMREQAEHEHKSQFSSFQHHNPQQERIAKMMRDAKKKHSFGPKVHEGQMTPDEATYLADANTGKQVRRASERAGPRFDGVTNNEDINADNAIANAQAGPLSAGNFNSAQGQMNPFAGAQQAYGNNGLLPPRTQSAGPRGPGNSGSFNGYGRNQMGNQRRNQWGNYGQQQPNGQQPGSWQSPYGSFPAGDAQISRNRPRQAAPYAPAMLDNGRN